MKILFLGVFLLSAYVLTASSAPAGKELGGCVTGNQLPGQSEPNVEVSALPSLSIPALGEIEIKCDANAANPALPPITIMIHVGPHLMKECDNAWEPVNECRLKLKTFFPEMPKEISCTAVNSKGECRIDNAQVVLLRRTEFTGPLRQTNNTNMTTMAPNVTTITPGVNMTTSPPNATTASPENTTTTSSPPPPTEATTVATPPTPTTVPTPTPTTDDDDTDTDTDNESDSDDSDDSDSDDSDSDSD